MTTAIAIGRVVVEDLYGGDVAAWRTRTDRDQCLRRLSGLLGGDVSASQLSRACGLYELEQRLRVSARPELTATHCYAVLGLPAEKQEEILRAAQERRLTTRDLETEARRARQIEGERRGRPPLPAVVKSIHRVNGALAAAGALDDVERLSSQEADELLRKVRAIRERCEHLEARLKDHAA